jgi:hypothetical protein
VGFKLIKLLITNLARMELRGGVIFNIIVYIHDCLQVFVAIIPQTEMFKSLYPIYKNCDLLIILRLLVAEENSFLPG